MKSDSKRRMVGLSPNLSEELAVCLIYEAYEKIESAEKQKQHGAVFNAFLNLGRAKSCFREDISFELEFEMMLYTAKKKHLSDDFSEEELEKAAEAGLKIGEEHLLSTEMGPDAIHYGFVAEMASRELRDCVRCLAGESWEVLKDHTWHKRPKERGIVGLIYEVMRRKIKIWRKALEGNGLSVRGTGGWLEKLEKNINDPDWLSKVEELLLRVDYFFVPVVTEDD